MGITGYDISILPGLIFFGIILIPILFFISFLFNLFVFWLTLKLDKIKIKVSEILLPILIHTIIVGITEVILLFISYVIVRNFGLADLLYGIFSFGAIFFIFKLFVPKFVKMGEKKNE